MGQPAVVEVTAIKPFNEPSEEAEYDEEYEYGFEEDEEEEEEKSKRDKSARKKNIDDAEIKI
jgi:hypothetical protein